MQMDLRKTIHFLHNIVDISSDDDESHASSDIIIFVTSLTHERLLDQIWQFQTELIELHRETSTFEARQIKKKIYLMSEIGRPLKMHLVRKTDKNNSVWELLVLCTLSR
jgi:hypothetical protein